MGCLTPVRSSGLRIEAMTPGYTAVSVIGRGAGSTLHKVRHRESGKFYTLKQVKKVDDPEGRFFEQIQREWKVGQAVAHPNLREIYDLHRTRKRFKVVEFNLLMEYLEGRTLDQAGLSGIATLLGVFTEVASALHAMHQAGFVHADIKPSNIMLCNGAGVKIFDLGQSCGLGSVKQRIQGTPDFIAPEQVMKLPMSERTDVFNLGATMYWCLTGKFFPTRIRGQQKAGAFDIGLVRDAESPQEINPQVPTGLSKLVMDCCRNSPANRPTMGEVLDRFRAVSHALKIVRE